MATKLVLLSLSLAVAACVGYTCTEPFTYSLYGRRVNFPMSVDEAIKAYKLIPNEYREVYSAETLIESAVMVHYKRGYTDFRYEPRTPIATRKYFNYDCYAIRFRIADSTATRTQILTKLRKDFGGHFEQKKTRYNYKANYYETRVNDCVAILVFGDIDAFGQRVPNTTSVVFCYKLNHNEVTAFMETGGWIYLGG